jgi:hypothetical protein
MNKAEMFYLTSFRISDKSEAIIGLPKTQATQNTWPVPLENLTVETLSL